MWFNVWGEIIKPFINFNGANVPVTCYKRFPMQRHNKLSTIQLLLPLFIPNVQINISIYMYHRKSGMNHNIATSNGPIDIAHDVIDQAQKGVISTGTKKLLAYNINSETERRKVGRYHYLKRLWDSHYSDVIMSAMASPITSPTIVYSTVRWGAELRKHQSSASPGGIHGTNGR